MNEAGYIQTGTTSLTDTDYRTLAIENGNAAQLLAERLRNAEARLAQADDEVRRLTTELNRVRSDMQTLVQRNTELSYELERARKQSGCPYVNGSIERDNQTSQLN